MDLDQFRGLSRAIGLPPAEVIAKLPGAPGKWQACQDAAGKEKYIVCNAVDTCSEAQTASWLFNNSLYSVLEGVLIGAYAVGAGRGFICLNSDNPATIEHVSNILKEMRQERLLGENILDSGFAFDLEAIGAPRSLVAREETALIRFLEGKQLIPYLASVPPSVRGYRNNPTMVEDAETFSRIAAAFREDEPGQDKCLVSLAGDVTNLGVVQVTPGITVGEIIEEYGGGAIGGKSIMAVQIGGPAGAFLSPESLDLPVSEIKGPGIIRVYAGNRCPVRLIAEIMDTLQGQSCGLCVFCREGTIQMADILKDIMEFKSRPADIELLQELAVQMKSGSICGLGRAVPDMLSSSLRLFRQDFETHISGNCLFAPKTKPITNK